MPAAPRASTSGSTPLSTSSPSGTPSGLPDATSARRDRRATGRDPLRAQKTRDLLERADRTTEERERHRLHDEVVVLNMGVADAVAARYRSRGVAQEDLAQVAYLALTKAVQRYDAAAAGGDFLSYAVPTMRGEVRRYFRDHGWMVRPTRRIQELQSAVSKASEQLSSDLGRSPRPSELAEHLGEDVDAVREALAADGCFQPASLDRPAGEDSGATLGSLIGADDDGWSAVEARVALQPVVSGLSDRDRHILDLRFVGGLTQSEIAEDIGVTQMQVSRLLSRILGDLRSSIGELDAG